MPGAPDFESPRCLPSASRAVGAEDCCTSSGSRQHQHASTQTLLASTPTCSVFAAVDPCPNNNGGCSADATCTFVNGGRSCTCKTGFTGNGFACAGE
jgi:hypothetical protein